MLLLLFLMRWMKKRRQQQVKAQSSVLLLMLTFAALHVGSVNAQPVDPVQFSNVPPRVLADLQAIDASTASGSRPVVVKLRKLDVDTRQVYQAYVERAADISQELVRVKKWADVKGGMLNLQHLSARTQQVQMKNQEFAQAFDHGEEEFYTYQLIQKAVASLEDAVTYWRHANTYREMFRGSTLNQYEDDETLKIKLKTAFNAIQELDRIRETADAMRLEAQQ
ncbi:MAG: hypothetical protein KTR14_03485 [Vampirovibrio sp.]|nr:hypothetical protein [Vampirovibrio sp.]